MCLGEQLLQQAALRLLMHARLLLHAAVVATWLPLAPWFRELYIWRAAHEFGQVGAIRWPLGKGLPERWWLLAHSAQDAPQAVAPMQRSTAHPRSS